MSELPPEGGSHAIPVEIAWPGEISWLPPPGARCRLRDLDDAAAARILDCERLDLVVHHARADVEQFRGVLLDPVRHLQRLDQRLALDLLERDPGRRDLDDRAAVARRRGGRELAEA